MAATRRRFGWPEDSFHVPEDVASFAAELAAGGARRRQRWLAGFDEWAARHPDAAAQWTRAQAGELPAELTAALGGVAGGTLATRQASGRVLAAAGAVLPELVGGSADLAGSTGTDQLPGGVVRAGNYSGRTIAFGIREHAMAAVLNGLALHGGLRPFGSTFLVFSDYLRPALRLSALMRLPVVYLLTHDSVAVGEDGPTHQPVEHLESLRLIPDLAVLRPGDAAETVSAWDAALRRTDGPTALVLSRQALPELADCELDTVARFGARVVHRGSDEPRVTILASGSEVALAHGAAAELTASGVPTRAVSVCWRERFAELPAVERDRITGGAAVMVAVEAGPPGGWVELTGSADRVMGLSRFGTSGPGPAVLDHLGFRQPAVVALARAALARADARSGHA